MINLSNVEDFCNWMVANFSASFDCSKTRRGFVILGSFFTNSGQLISLSLVIHNSSIDVVALDQSRRSVFSTKVTGNINHDSRVLDFLYRVSQEY